MRNNYLHHRKEKGGFTLIEMLVSLSLFTIVATMSVGTLLVLIGSNGRVVSEQSVMTSLTFALDSMSREIRTGSEYRCGSVAGVTGAAVTGSATAVNDCPTGMVGLSFREAGTSITGGSSNNRVAYYYQNNALWRKVGTSDAEQIVTGDVKITDVRFYVTGSNPITVGSDTVQPSVTIVIDAVASSSESSKPFTIQTTVVQRPLDI